MEQLEEKFHEATGARKKLIEVILVLIIVGADEGNDRAVDETLRLLLVTREKIIMN